MGAGKGTLGLSIQRALLLPWVSVGNHIRAVLSQQTQASELLRARLSVCEPLVIDERFSMIMLDLALTLSAPHLDSGFSIDGFPRVARDSAHAVRALRITDVVWVDATEAQCRERIERRGRRSDTTEKIERRLRTEASEIPALYEALCTAGVRGLRVDAGLPPSVLTRTVQDALQLSRRLVL
jgi:adenylate kinase family enzyme